MKTKFYTYGQNNSGGSFIIDKSKGIGYYVIIEALNEEQATSIAEDIGLYFDGCSDGIDCDCCGDRWYSPNESESPEIYGTSVEICEEDKRNYIHYLDGSIKNFDYQ